MTDTNTINRIYDMAFGAFLISVVYLAIFYCTSTQQVCEDGHVGFRIEQCLEKRPAAHPPDSRPHLEGKEDAAR